MSWPSQVKARVKTNISDLTGMIFGKLTVLGFDSSKSNNLRKYWLCQCECGEVKSVQRKHLMSGNTKGCGCQKGQKKKHGHHTNQKASGTYKTWQQMNQRCINPKAPKREL